MTPTLKRWRRKKWIDKRRLRKRMTAGMAYQTRSRRARRTRAMCLSRMLLPWLSTQRPRWSLLLSKSRLQVSHRCGQPGVTTCNFIRRPKQSKSNKITRWTNSNLTWVTFWKIIIQSRAKKNLWIRANSCSQLTARLASITSASHRKLRISRRLFRRAGARHRLVESVRWAMRNIVSSLQQSINYFSNNLNPPMCRIRILFWKSRLLRIQQSNRSNHPVHQVSLRWIEGSALTLCRRTS